MSARRWGAAVFWAAVAGAALFAWRWVPQGFPLGHPRFIVSEVAPLTCTAAALFGVFCAAVKRPAFESRVVLAALLLAFTAAVLALFGRAGLFAAAVVGPSGLVFLVLAREAAARVPRRSVALALFAALVGVGAAWALRAPEASTRPHGTLPENGAPAAPVETACGRLQLRIDPALHFEQASRERFWSIFDGDDARASIGPATLVQREQPFFLDSGRALAETVYAHLDTFARIDVWRAKQLKVRFGPGTQAVEVLASDYPVGRPMRFAAFDGQMLRAYEATSAEKGPFRNLAETPLRRGDPLVLELLDGDEVQCRVTLLDFTSQASTELSPTAGFGIAQNAIELLASEQAPAQTILFSLAATSVGRGWDTVGHAPGNYRNRMRVE